MKPEITPPKHTTKSKNKPMTVYLDSTDTVGVRAPRNVPETVVKTLTLLDLPFRLHGKYQFPLDTKDRRVVFNAGPTEQRKLIACLQLGIGWETLHTNLREYACTPEVLTAAYGFVNQMRLAEDKRKVLTPAQSSLKDYFYTSNSSWLSTKPQKQVLRDAVKTLFCIELPDVSVVFLYKLLEVMKKMYGSATYLVA